ncbi:conserved hypothetical protein [Gammaproteobacteria bacterium]
MIQIEQFTKLYSSLPTVAQQEAFYFLEFLQKCYDGVTPLHQVTTNNKPTDSIRSNPAFGMWADLQEDSREFLN